MPKPTNKRPKRSKPDPDRQPSWIRRLARQAVENAVKSASTAAGTACVGLIVWWAEHR